ncbi:MAG: DUF7146 domain-containing protein [Albimonas sp.]|uniref:DUF7146 domain-containing protein n=1 Tax=Albimonas sp. TaxID=1872425 RepID=UPI004057353D
MAEKIETRRAGGRGRASEKPSRAAGLTGNISQTLSAVTGDARAVTAALGGKWQGRNGSCRCPAHRDRVPSLSVSDGRDGRLLLHCFAGCDFRDVLAALKDRGLIRAAGPAVELDPQAEAMRAAAEARERAKRIAQARTAWAEAGPLAGTLAERYLRGRAIRGPLPHSLRFAPNCWHKSARRLPAMVAAVEMDDEAEPVAVHRTYLAEPGCKAAVAPAKAMLGPVAGAAVRLSNGPGPLVVAEGIETGLSLADALESRRPRVWAALSASGLAGLRLPLAAGELIVAPDPDPMGWAAAEKLADRAHRAGWRVRILPPPGENMDWNDKAVREAGR